MEWHRLSSLVFFMSNHEVKRIRAWMMRWQQEPCCGCIYKRYTLNPSSTALCPPGLRAIPSGKGRYQGQHNACQYETVLCEEVHLTGWRWDEISNFPTLGVMRAGGGVATLTSGFSSALLDVTRTLRIPGICRVWVQIFGPYSTNEWISLENGFR